MFGGKVDRQTFKERHSMGTMAKQFVKDVTRAALQGSGVETQGTL